MNKSIDLVALIPAAGIGTRMQSECPKQYLLLHGKTILEHTLDALLIHPAIKQIVVALHPHDDYFNKLPIAKDPRINVVIGGNERADSVLAGLNYIADNYSDECWALVHDAARPCLALDDLNRLLATVETNLTQKSDINKIVGAILASPVRDTMKRSYANKTGFSQIESTIDRQQLWHALTPQLFPVKLLRDCLTQALSEDVSITDEASALEYCGYQPLLINGRADNIKVTQPEDLALAEFYLSRKQQEQTK